MAWEFAGKLERVDPVRAVVALAEPDSVVPVRVPLAQERAISARAQVMDFTARPARVDWVIKESLVVKVREGVLPPKAVQTRAHGQSRLLARLAEIRERRVAGETQRQEFAACALRAEALVQWPSKPA